jgi:uncharacterized protein YkwD
MVPKSKIVSPAVLALVFFITQMRVGFAASVSAQANPVTGGGVTSSQSPDLFAPASPDLPVSPALKVPLTKEEPKLAPPVRPMSPANSANTGTSGSSTTQAAPLPNSPSSGSQDLPAATGVQTPYANNSGSSNQSANPSLPPSSNLGQISNPDNYPVVGKMETVTFGNAHQEQQIDQRLSALEEAVFKQAYQNESLFDRTQRLKMTILGTLDEPPESAGVGDFAALPPSGLTTPGLVDMRNTEGYYLDEIARNPESHKELDGPEVARCAVELVNYARNLSGSGPLRPDELAQTMANNHASDLARRNVLSHASETGDNPDLRYTAVGGTDAVTESVDSVAGDFAKSDKPTKAAVAMALKTMMDRQDDRDAILSPDATGLGFAMAYMSARGKFVACSETSTKHGIMQPIATPITVGDKVEVQGLIHQPYRFDRITVAWEGGGNNIPSASDEAEDALPYFPPLDYVAYANKAEHDYEKTMATLRAVALVAAIAGGVFMPPVALAAPLIVATGGMSEPKPLSDIPVHGGVKAEGMTFSGKIPLAKGGKDGVYYVTVWASSGRGGKSVPVSRRAYLVGAGASVAGQGPEASQDSGTHKKKHTKHKLDTQAELEN